MQIEEGIEIKRPVEDVYAFMANVNNLPKCSGAIQEVRDAPDRAVEPGDTYTSVAKVMGRMIETSHVVRQADPPTFMDIEGKTGRTTMQVTIRIEETDTGARVTQRGEGEPGGALRFVGGIIERTIRYQMQEDLWAMKQFMEQSPEE